MTRKAPLKRVDDADRRASRAVSGARDSGWLRALGTAGEIGDQPQLRLLCAATIGIAALQRDPKLLATGFRMLAAHTLATLVKDGIKAVVDRTRPDKESEGYTAGLGKSRDHDQNSFPSGHSAGAIAVMQAYSRAYPANAFGARAVATAVAAIQVPRASHFIGDVVAGSLIGIASEAVSSPLLARRKPMIRTEGWAPFTVALPPTARNPPGPLSTGALGRWR